jgi:hypothetical protein
LSTVPSISKSIPKNIPGYGVAALTGLAFYLVGHVAFVSGSLDKDVNKALQEATIPLWK